MTTRQADPYGRGSYCVVVALHGTDSAEAETLRRFRDDVLRRLPAGDRLVDAYYHASPRLVGALADRRVASDAVATAITAFSRAFSPVL